MRIRSIKPEFWRSDDITALSIEDRLLFVGMWSYVDDNGVGVDKLALITADLFAGDIEKDARETFARVSRGLQNLAEAGLIHRYEVDGKPFLEVDTWADHQRIDKPNKPRYPQHDADSAVIRDTLATPSRDSRETVAPGTGEQGNRGTGEQILSPTPAAPSRADEKFDEFWDAYAKKVGRKKAEQKWQGALRKPDVTPDDLIAAAKSYIASQRAANKHPEFTKDPATWLNGEHWNDEALPVYAANARPPAAPTHSPWDTAARPPRREESA